MTASTQLRYGALVEARGLGGSHHMILGEVRDGARVLDIGCATGYLAAALTARGCEVVGVERDRTSAAIAEAVCEDVIVADIESPEDRQTLPRGFDFVLLGDVLEHLIDPSSTLAFTRELLAPGGIVVVSIPNVAAWPVRLGLLLGRFDYGDFGILDRTHLRFFTRVSVHELVRGAGFAIERERFPHLERRPGPLRRALPLPMSIVDRTLARLFPGVFAQQFVLRLRPFDGGPDTAR
jgi:2-polyprenyl-3-methyl-5-hydroxy-6-metoxy-1,4-benzoquinol methylase